MAGAVQRKIVIALVVVAAARGGYWAGVATVWHRDEPQHYAYVDSIAAGKGLPVIGEDQVPLEVTQLAKASVTGGWGPTDVSASPDDPGWGVFTEQYEAGQGPFYYALLALPLRALDGLDVTTRVLLLRLLSVLLTLPAVPLAWLLGRRLFPGLPEVGVLAAGVLVVWQGFNAGGATILNDALVLPLGLAALLAVARAMERPSWLDGLWLGTSFGLAILTKATAVVLLAPLALGVAGVIIRHRDRPGAVLGWLGTAGLAAGACVLPWLLWQRVAYQGESPVDRFNELLGPILGPARSFGPETLGGYWRTVHAGLFELGVFSQPYHPHALLPLGMAAFCALAGVVALLRRGEHRGARRLLWLTVTPPLAFITMALVIRLALQGIGGMDGRYLQPVLGVFALVIAAGASALLGPRLARIAVLGFVAVTLTLEVGVVDNYLTNWYLNGLHTQGQAPVVNQSQADRYQAPRRLEVQSPCPVTLIGVGLVGTPPGQLVVGSGAAGQTQTAPGVAIDALSGEVVMGFYRPETPLAQFTLDLPALTPALIPVADDERESALRYEGGGDPVARLYCSSADPAGSRFQQTFWPQHPDWPLGLVQGWPRAWAIAAWGALAVTFLAKLARSGRRSRGRHQS